MRYFLIWSHDPIYPDFNFSSFSHMLVLRVHDLVSSIVMERNYILWQRWLHTNNRSSHLCAEWNWNLRLVLYHQKVRKQHRGSSTQSGIAILCAVSPP